MDTIVCTTDPIDFGAGAHHKQTFAACSWHVDDTGTLHIVKQSPNRGNCASFAPGSWQFVVEGGVVTAANR